MWPDSVDEILAGDQAIALAHTTPAHGVVLTPVTNFAMHDKVAGTVSVNSSVGMWRKLARIASAPEVALAFHTREHGHSHRPEYVLVQGRATLEGFHDLDAWHDQMRGAWERFGGQRRRLGPVRDWWLKIYHQRVNIVVAVERVLVWRGLDCAGPPEVHGSALPADAPPAQKPPGNGTGPRVDAAKVARRASRLPNVLLGWVGADGLPMVVPVRTPGARGRGIELESEAPLPEGGRRAGLLAHSFSRYVVGQRQSRHTGWLEDGCYAPHTEHRYTLPPVRLFYNAGAGFVTRRGVREARRAGFLPG